MGTSAEDQTGIHTQRDASLLRNVQPLGNDDQSLPDPYGPVVLFPVILPVLVADRGHGVLPRHPPADPLQFPASVVAVFKIETYGAHPGQLPEHVIVHVIPVFPVFFQKVPDGGLVQDHQSRNARLLQVGAGPVQPVRLRREGDLQPVHTRSRPSFRRQYRLIRCALARILMPDTIPIAMKFVSMDEPP